MTDHCDVQTFFRFERSFCRCMAAMSCALGWCVCDLTCFQVMWLVVRWFVVLLRYYSVLQRTTTYYSNTTPTYYSVLQSTTTYYSSTTLYYKVLLQYHSVLRQYYSVLRQYYNLLLRYYFETSFTMRGATRVSVQLHQILRLPRKMNVINDLHCVTYETSFPMRGASKVTLQPHQMLRLPHKINVIDDPHHIWNVICNARSK